MSTTVGPTKFPQTLSKGQAVIPLQPFFGCTTQTTDQQTSPWVPVPPGSTLQLILAIAALTGTLNVFIETCNQITAGGVAVDSPRPIGWFRQTPNVVPSSTPMSGGQPCDNYIRVNATPGAGVGQTATWSVTGNAITLAHATSTTVSTSTAPRATEHP